MITGDRLTTGCDIGIASEGPGGQGDDLLGVGDLAEDGSLEEEAVADHADEAGGPPWGDVRGDPGGGSFAGDQGPQGVADEVGAAAPALAEAGVGAAAAALLDDHGRPVGVFGGQTGEDVGDRAGLPAGGLALGVVFQDGQEQVELGREVVEDRPSGAAGGLLQADDGRLLVAVGGEAASRPLEN